MLFLIFITIFIFVVLVSISVAPTFYKYSIIFREKREKAYALKIDQIMSRSEAKKMSRFFVFAPVTMAIAGYFLLPSIPVIGIIAGFILGLIVPGAFVSIRITQARMKFNEV